MSRIHIIGCARSGTSLLAEFLTGFENSQYGHKESSPVWDPSLQESIALFKRQISVEGRGFYITKRAANWFMARQVESLERLARSDKIGVIHIIRDPRDVLTSQHFRNPEKRDHDTPYYVSPRRWLASLEAAEHIFKALSSYPLKTTIRYEDLVTHPEEVALGLNRTFGIKRAKTSPNWSEEPISTGADKYIAELQHLSASRVARWKTDPEAAKFITQILHDRDYKTHLISFINSNNYVL